MNRTRLRDRSQRRLNQRQRELVESHLPDLENLARRLASGNPRLLPSERIEIVYLVACEAAADWDPDGAASFFTFAYRYAFTALMNEVRWLGYRDHESDCSSCLTEDSCELEDQDWFRAAEKYILRQLGESHWSIMLDYVVEGMTLPQLAEKYGTNRETIRQRKNHVLALLRSHFGE